MSIKIDPKFVALVKRHGEETIDAAVCKQRYDYCFGMKHLYFNDWQQAQDKADHTLRNIYKYIDRYVEAKLKEREDKKAQLKHLYEKKERTDSSDLTFTCYYHDEYIELMTIKPDGLVCINANNTYGRSRYFNTSWIKDLIFKELLIICPLALYQNKLTLDVRFDEHILNGYNAAVDLNIIINFDGAIIRKFLPSERKDKIDWIEFHPRDIAKHISDKINGIALKHASE